LSYLPAVVIVGLIADLPDHRQDDRKRLRLAADIVAGLAGSIIVYAGGVSWLKAVTGVSWGKAVALGLVPFLIGDAFKIVAAAIVAGYGRKLMRSR